MTKWMIHPFFISVIQLLTRELAHSHVQVVTQIAKFYPPTPLSKKDSSVWRKNAARKGKKGRVATAVHGVFSPSAQWPPISPLPAPSTLERARITQPLMCHLFFPCKSLFFSTQVHLSLYPDLSSDGSSVCCTLIKLSHDFHIFHKSIWFNNARTEV